MAQGFSGLDELSNRLISAQSVSFYYYFGSKITASSMMKCKAKAFLNRMRSRGKRKGPPICYRPKPPMAEPLPSDGTMKFVVMRQVKEAIDIQNELRLEGSLCDITLICKGASFPCHKITLASASPYFRAMFTHGMSECCKNEICMNNIEPEILSTILDFIYTAEIKVTEGNVCALMQASAMLAMPHITEACTTFLGHQLDPSNCIGIRRFAHEYQCEELFEQAHRYLLKNFSDVTMNEEFRELPVTELINILSSDQLSVKCESEVYKGVLSWVSRDFEARNRHLPCLLEKIRLTNIPPKFIKEQLDCCPLLKRAPSECTQKLTKLFQKLQMHCCESAQPRQSSDKQVIYCIGGYMGQSASNVEFLNPQTREWKRGADAPHPRSGLAACTIMGQIYAVGGRNSHQQNTDLSGVDCYDPAANSWTPMPPMLCRRHRVSVNVLDNKLYALGGANGVEAHNSMECLDPQTRQWTMLAPMNHKRIAAGTAVVNRYLYVVGGFDGSQRLSSMEQYHPEENRWSACPSMSTQRSGAGVASLGSYIYVAGGFDSTTQLDSVERYDTRTGVWERVANMIHARSALNMVSTNGKLYVLGGYGGNGFVAAVECYDPVKNTWTEVVNMVSSKSGQGVTIGPLPSDP